MNFDFFFIIDKTCAYGIVGGEFLGLTTNAGCGFLLDI